MSDRSEWSDLATDVVLRLVGATDEDLDDVVNDTLGLIATRCDAERGYVTFYDPTRSTFDISHEWTAGVVPQRGAIQNVELSRFPWSVGYAERQEMLVVHDLDELPPEAEPEHESFGAFGVRAIVQVPIVLNGVTVGIAGLNRFREGVRWDDSLLEFVRRAGQAVGVAFVRQRAAREVAVARARADEARRAREELLGHVSHELRTPLHAILGYAELLELDDRSDHDRDALMRIQTNGRHLLAMIDDLAQLARSSDGVPPVSVSAVVDEIVTDLQHIATDRGLALTAGDAIGVTGAVEVGRFRQVARCLVIGAAQSMRDGRITVDSAADAATASIRIRVASSRAIALDGLVLPMAEVLVLGRGRIDVTPSADRTTVAVQATFDQAAAAGAPRP